MTTPLKLETWASDIIAIIKTVPGTSQLVQQLSTAVGDYFPVTQALADRIQFALDDAEYTIDLMEDYMMIWKQEGKCLVIDWSSDEHVFPEIGLYDVNLQ